ncbi:hypothetical protein [Christiangramia crocea]|uniref:Uncharacterized protein n=1 Tax=Christiangramia crocea TaxID=2904124 RepID=A0A9X1UXM4_9FLAO|nr:hypothetical protein [Gramella crocea]MCG9972010.1 hypothetical protein [Gramella crocea]
MFNSKEIRWFSKTEDKAISNWFKKKSYSFEDTEARTDFYLPLTGKKEIGIKLREGKIEVKQLIAEPEKGNLSANAEGFFERYSKWSFSTSENDSLSKEIITEKKYDWLDVKKERMGVKLKKETNGNTAIVKIDEFISYGCQIEYTRIKVKETTWYSFGLEWFGEKELEVDQALIHEILGDSRLNPDESMGYAEFLNLEIFSG